MELYKDKTILITGASSGIGEEFANTLNQYGAKLILTARSKDKLDKMALEMNNALVISGDLSDESFPQELYNKIKEKDIKIDIIINNAGFGFSGLFLDSPIENYKEMLNVNIYSLTALTHLFLNDMKDQGEGGIINVSSLASFQAIPYFAVYAATKAYVTSFTLALFEEYRNYGINILGVCPGYTKTNFNKRAEMSSSSVVGYRMTSKEVVDQSLNAYRTGKYIIINGKINKFAKMITSIIPTKLALKMARSIIKKGKDAQQW